jgi:hypothetical protein
MRIGGRMMPPRQDHSCTDAPPEFSTLRPWQGTGFALAERSPVAVSKIQDFVMGFRGDTRNLGASSFHRR